MCGQGVKFFTLGGGSMFLLVVLLAILLVYITERAIFLHSGNVKPQQFIDGITALLGNNRYREAMTICEETPGFVPTIVKIALFCNKENREATDYAVKNFVLSVVPTLERRLRSIALVGKIAPAIGCIGASVVFFKFMANSSDASYLQSESLFALIKNILTIIPFSLFIGILANVGYSFLYGRVRTLMYNMEWSYVEIANYLARIYEK
ncbi:MAG: MotA/TolQ/ExbB proton channel family protein [Puniceicoccales bacterium]|jgi:biopolymer transport protein ExbB|nr:MotA/TolQ/ExbB proton channel family protein [Puniceicoccales bacterium]